MTSGADLEKLLRERTLLVCVGSGGVGKTTSAAALALRAARLGRRVLVLTIDPARRLANSLGLQRFGNEETRIPLGPEVQGELWAMMLDTRTTFDNTIRRVAKDEALRQRILANNIYRNISDSFASNQEYMATEQLHDVTTSGRYDLVVLDTPPVKNALDFLESPGRFMRFLDRAIMRWFLTPYDEGKVFGRLLVGTSTVVFRLLGFIFGKEFLTDLSEFFLAFRDLYDGFRERQEAVLRMFHDRRRTTFLVVAAPTGPSVEVARYFLDELLRRDMPIAGVLVNRVHEPKFREPHAETVLAEALARASQQLPPHVGRSVQARLVAAHHRLVEQADVEKSELVPLESDRRVPAIWRAPRLEEEVHDLASLDALGLKVFGNDAMPVGGR